MRRWLQQLTKLLVQAWRKLIQQSIDSPTYPWLRP